MEVSEVKLKDQPPYGIGDVSYQTVGGEAGIRTLVDDFYDAMAQLPEAEKIR